MSAISSIKKRIVPSGRSVRKIRAGLNRGLSMYLDLTCQSQIWTGLAERELSHYFLSLSKNIRTAVDVGGSEGYYTLFFLNRTPASRVFVFEPTSEGIDALMSNLTLNSFTSHDRLVVSQKYVGSIDADKWISLDSLQRDLEFPALVKVDIEGGEVDLLRGSKNLLEQDVRWIIEVHSKELERECYSILHEAGYQTHVISKAWWRVIVPELRPRGHNRWLVAYKS
jgi:hypothetical protein